jgi:hypothetical protein
VPSTATVIWPAFFIWDSVEPLFLEQAEKKGIDRIKNKVSEMKGNPRRVLPFVDLVINPSFITAPSSIRANRSTNRLACLNYIWKEIQVVQAQYRIMPITCQTI